MSRTQDRTVTLLFPREWIVEIETAIEGDNGRIIARVPILIPGREIQIDVTDLMTPEQCEKFAKRLCDKVTEISVKQLQTDFFTRGEGQ